MNRFKFVYRAAVQPWLDLGWTLDEEDEKEYNPVCVVWWKHDRDQEIPEGQS